MHHIYQSSRILFITYCYLNKSNKYILKLSYLQQKYHTIARTYMEERGSQPLPQTDDDPDIQDESTKPKGSCWVKIMFGYLYFVQGVVLSITGNMPYIYPQLPDYFVLSLFSFATLPFSFKFLTAPLLEKYSVFSYGKRKFWIIISETLAAIGIFVSSFYTDIQNAYVFVIILFVVYFALTFQDISLDALCLKELNSPKQMSTIQAACQTSGIIIGALLILKLTSLQFAQSIGRKSPIISIQTYLIICAWAVALPTVIIHFKFKETFLAADINTAKQSICSIYKIYRYFFNFDYKYCRILLFQLIFYQGLNFFTAGYNYEIVQLGFSRNTLNTIDNIQTGITSALVFIFGVSAFALGYKRSYIIGLSFLVLIYLYLWIFMPLTLVPVAITNILAGILDQWLFIHGTSLSADFPEHGKTGMLYTMGASCYNFGKNTFIHTAIIKKIPWKQTAIAGIILQVIIIILFIPKMLDIMPEGKTQIDLEEQEIDENQKQQKIQIEG